MSLLLLGVASLWWVIIVTIRWTMQVSSQGDRGAAMSELANRAAWADFGDRLE